ncbi:uncharacterized protein IL334_003310 [Kwoniella shivajii]|uniref:Peroxin/Ferlin domain-containing protein n=1 Tax=Kwoniella shivajii TaxID=564305 RepID=A0ABZ1CX78_9TREE|nr:hypothetical protein IL334_003310 [Kwoniella shivajii]
MPGPLPVPSTGATDPPPPIILQTSDLVSSLPAPFLRLLVLFARPIALLRKALEVLFWRGARRVQSWMVVGAWWALCLGSSHAFKYLLPPLVFLPFLPLSSLRLRASSKQPIKNASIEPSTSETLLITLSDLNAIYALLPSSPYPMTADVYARFRQLGPARLTRGLLVIWITWVILGKFIGYTTLLGILGSVCLLLPSPPLAHLINLLSKSLFIRRSLALMFLFVFGSPPEDSYRFSLKSHFSPFEWMKSKWTVSRRPSLAFSLKPRFTTKMNGPLPSGSAIDDSDEESNGLVKTEQPIYFKFEIHENQRWWMGLDWTSALLPQERPSWCDNHLQPVSPPSNFTLPSPTSIVVPSPTVNDPKAKVTRITNWKWLDEDWSIVRQGQGLNSIHHHNSATSFSASNTTSNQSVPSPTIPEHDDHGFSLANQSQSSGSSSRPTSFISPFGSSPPRTSTATMEESLSPGVRAQSIAEQAFTKGLERLKARTASVAAGATAAATQASSPRKNSDATRQRTMSQASEESHTDDGHHIPQSNVHVPVPAETIVDRDEATDGDGWVYGDNKWEGMGPKGGLGKFTRRRRWTRRAILVETVIKMKTADDPPIVVPSSAAGAVSVSTPRSGESTPVAMSSPMKSKPAPAVKSSIQPGGKNMTRSTSREAREEKDINPGIVGSTTGAQTRDDVLRSRLKKAMGSVGG